MGAHWGDTVATYSGIKIYQLGVTGAVHAQGDTIVGVYDMDVVDNGGTDTSGQPFTGDILHEMQLYYFNPNQSFTINGVTYLDVILLDTGTISIDGVEIDGARVEFVDSGTGQTIEHFIPLQSDAADAYTVQAGDTITTVFAVSGTDADQVDYADMYTGYTPPLDYIVEGTSGADTIDASYTGDPEGDMIDANDALDGSNDDSIEGGAGFDYIYAGASDDTISTGADGAIGYPGDGDDLIYGSDVNDRVEPSAGNDTMIGGLGNDLFWGATETTALMAAQGAIQSARGRVKIPLTLVLDTEATMVSQ